MTEKTIRKWRDRHLAEGPAGLQDRSSRPRRLHKPTPPEVIDRIASLRRQRRPGKEIATTVGVSPATVSRVLERLGLSKLSAVEPAEPPRRYEREQPGEIIHIDIKKLGKFNQVGHRVTGDRNGQSNSRGLAMGAYTACLDLALGLGSPALDLIASGAGLGAVFLSSTVVVLCSVPIALWLQGTA